MSELWVPGGALDIDDFVRRINQQIVRFAETHGLDQIMVEVELRDGSRHILDTISAEPGYGFVPRRPHATESDEPQELTTPPASRGQIRLPPGEENTQFGF